MRKLDDQFMIDLREKCLKDLLEVVHRDHTLCLEIRENYINIYYRGGNILCVRKKNNEYFYEFDLKYFNHDRYLMSGKPIVPTSGPITVYLELIPQLKQEMDRWFVENPKLEREVQQMILRDNNIDKIAKYTDYYISDIEYSNTENGSRFDIVGIKWTSDPNIRKNRDFPHVSLMELKYGDGSLAGDSGIVKHFQDIDKFVSSNRYKTFVQEVEIQFNQKIELGLVYEQTKPVHLNIDAKPEFVFIFVNHKAASSVLDRELTYALNLFPNIETKLDVKIAQSSFVGYGLYEKSMINAGTYSKSLEKDLVMD